MAGSSYVSFAGTRLSLSGYQSSHKFARQSLIIDSKAEVSDAGKPVFQVTPSESRETIQKARELWRETYSGGHLSLARLVRFDYQRDNYKFTFKTDSASMENGSLKFILQQDKPSIHWSRPL